MVQNTEQTKEPRQPLLPEQCTWFDVDWHRGEAVVLRLQERLYRATANQQWAKIKSLQKLLVRATSTKEVVTRYSKGSSRMTGDGHVRFLRGWVTAMPPGYLVVVSRKRCWV